MAHPDEAIPRRPFLISVWFLMDAVLCLFPPIYWIAGGPRPVILGFPCSVVYYIGMGVFITASLLVAYWSDERRGAFNT